MAAPADPKTKPDSSGEWVVFSAGECGFGSLEVSERLLWAIGLHGLFARDHRVAKQFLRAEYGLSFDIVVGKL